jgi:hypothetical protein
VSLSCRALGKRACPKDKVCRKEKQAIAGEISWKEMRKGEDCGRTSHHGVHMQVAVVYESHASSSKMRTGRASSHFLFSRFFRAIKVRALSVSLVVCVCTRLEWAKCADVWRRSLTYGPSFFPRCLYMTLARSLPEWWSSSANAKVHTFLLLASFALGVFPSFLRFRFRNMFMFFILAFFAVQVSAMCLVPNCNTAFQICLNSPNNGVYSLSTTYGYGNVTISNNVFTFISATWSGNLWWRAVQICFCQSYNCQNGINICSDALEVSSNWNLNGALRAIGYGGSCFFSSLQFTGYGAKKDLNKDLPPCNSCFSNVNGVAYACCDEMSIDNGVCSCDGNVPCTQCSPSRSDKEKIFPHPSQKESSSLPSCNGCFSSYNGIYYSCCDNLSINNGDCTCDGGAPCTQCSRDEKDMSQIPPHSDFCWDPSCGLFSGTCCSNGQQCCYDNSKANPCTADCACVCSNWVCPPNAVRAPSYFNWVNSNGTCGRALAATSDNNCLYDSQSCQPWCMCNPGYRSNQGCFVEGQAPVLSNGYCVPMNDDEVKTSKAGIQRNESEDEKQSHYNDPAACVKPKTQGIVPGILMTWPFKMVSLTLTDQTSYCSGGPNWSGFCYASPDSYGGVQCTAPSGANLGLSQTTVSWSSSLIMIAQVTLPYQSPMYWSMNGALVWTTNTTAGAYMWSICSGTNSGCQWSLSVTVLH